MNSQFKGSHPKLGPARHVSSFQLCMITVMLFLHCKLSAQALPGLSLTKPAAPKAQPSVSAPRPPIRNNPDAMGQSKSSSAGQWNILREDRLSTINIDLPLQCHDQNVYVMSSGSKRSFGTPRLVRRIGKGFNLYRFSRLNNAPPKRIYDAFGQSLLEGGFACDGFGHESYRVHCGNVGGLFPARAPQLKANLSHANREKQFATAMRPEGLPFNAFHPSLHPNGKILVFCSDQPRVDSLASVSLANSGIDLFYSVQENGRWGHPVRFDSLVNSEADELFPSFNARGDMYFSSNRTGGQGGFDLYGTSMRWDLLLRNKSGGTSSPMNLGKEVNGLYDDYVIAWNLDKRNEMSGYIGTDSDGAGDVDVYSFKVGYVLIKGRVLSAMDQAPMPKVPLVLVSTATKQRDTVYSDAKGGYKFKARFGDAYQLCFPKLGFEGGRDTSFSTENVGTVPVVSIPTSYLQVRPAKAFVTIIGTTFSGKDFKRSGKGPTIKQFGEEAAVKDIRVKQIGKTFTITCPSSASIYFEFSNPGYATVTRHFLPERFEGSDTITWDIEFEPGGSKAIQGIAIDNASGKPITYPVAKLIWFDPESKSSIPIATDIGDSSGLFRFSCPSKYLERCSVVVGQIGFIPAVFDLKTDVVPNIVPLVSDRGFEVSPILLSAGVMESLGSLYIRKQVEAFGQFLLYNPYSKLRIVSHTDCRGKDLDNLEKARQTAEQLRDYIIARTGLDQTRFLLEPVGAAKPQNPCDCEKGCTPEDHAANRRIEIFLIPRVGTRISTNYQDTDDSDDWEGPALEPFDE